VNELLIEHARSGRIVVRLKGGDPFVFGRGGEELSALRAAGIMCEVVPGVTAGVAVPAYAGIPVTHRHHASAVAFITGHEHAEKPDSQLDWDTVASFPGTLVFYMGVRQLSHVANALIKAGKPEDTPAAIIEWGTTPRQRTVAALLSEIAAQADQAHIHPPAVIVIGQVAQLAGTLNWFEARPLFGQRIVVTRPIRQALSSVSRLVELGAELVELPALRIEPPTDWSLVDRAIGELNRYEWVVFTSANGVQHFMNRMVEKRQDARAFGKARIAAIGPATSNELVRLHHIEPDLVPAESNSEALLKAVLSRGNAGRVLLIRADAGREVFAAGLRTAGIACDEVAAYRVHEETQWDATVIQRLEKAEVDWITVTSPRTVRALESRLPDTATRHIGNKIKVASISPLTSAAARSAGWEPIVEARDASMDSLIDAIVRWKTTN
jgi:uroporphyrinogen III methyltransferase/synthase